MFYFNNLKNLEADHATCSPGVIALDFDAALRTKASSTDVLPHKSPSILPIRQPKPSQTSTLMRAHLSPAILPSVHPIGFRKSAPDLAGSPRVVDRVHQTLYRRRGKYFPTKSESKHSRVPEIVDQSDRLRLACMLVQRVTDTDTSPPCFPRMETFHLPSLARLAAPAAPPGN